MSVRIIYLLPITHPFCIFFYTYFFIFEKAFAAFCISDTFNSTFGTFAAFGFAAIFDDDFDDDFAPGFDADSDSATRFVLAVDPTAADRVPSKEWSGSDSDSTPRTRPRIRRRLLSFPSTPRCCG